MLLYMGDFGRDGKSPINKDKYEAKLKKLKEKYTNYGCYCWIDGAEHGVIGGGSTRDMTDHHCKELYRCYKCVNIDYAKNYTEVAYTVDFTMKNGERFLDCKSSNSKQDSENVCECDKRFAINIALAEDDCKANEDGFDASFGSYCLNDTYRTETGGGEFNPRAECEKKFHNQEKDRCCGIYPNRYPYDIDHQDCCEKNLADHNAEMTATYKLEPSTGKCADNGGVAVVSQKGDPHSYVNANRESL